MSIVTWLSDATSVREDGLRLLISILLGYPIAAFYRYFIYTKTPVTQQWFITIIGLALYWFNIGIHMYHCLLDIAMAYVITNYFAKDKIAVILAHTCFMVCFKMKIV